MTKTLTRIVIAFFAIGIGLYPLMYFLVDMSQGLLGTKSNATLWVCCLFVKSCMKAKRPLNLAYPVNLTTIGDHLRKTRLDRRMSQPEVALLLGVTTETVTGWELNHHQPYAKDARKIIEFLGYIPSAVYSGTIGAQLRLARMVAGMTQKQAAARIGCDASNLRVIELGKRRPTTKIRSRLLRYIETFIKESV